MPLLETTQHIWPNCEPNRSSIKLCISRAYLLHLRSKHNASEDDRVPIQSILRYPSRCVFDASLPRHHGSFGLAEAFHQEDINPDKRTCHRHSSPVSDVRVALGQRRPWVNQSEGLRGVVGAGEPLPLNSMLNKSKIFVEAFLIDVRVVSQIKRPIKRFDSSSIIETVASATDEVNDLSSTGKTHGLIFVRKVTIKRHFKP